MWDIFKEYEVASWMISEEKNMNKRKVILYIATSLDGYIGFYFRKSIKKNSENFLEFFLHFYIRNTITTFLIDMYGALITAKHV